jgi:putative protease
MEKEIGKVEDYFSKIGVLAITLSGNLKIGDKIKVKGATTEFEQVVESMQIDKKPVKSARAGNSVGIKVNDLARKTDKVYKIS